MTVREGREAEKVSLPSVRFGSTFMTDQCVSEGALAVLREIECDPDRTRITSGQLDRSLYEEVNEVLVRLGGK